MRDVTTIYDALHWYHLYNLKNVKNNHGGVLLLVLKITPPWVFSCFSNCTNGTKLSNTSQILKFIKYGNME